MMRVLLTGAAGFAGSHIACELVRQDHEVVALDRLTYAGHLENLLGLNVHNVCHDLGEPLTAATLREIGAVDYVIHNAAESHVSRSLVDPGLFVRSNVLGTLNLLEAARELRPKKFIYASTDEVFGPAEGRSFQADDALRPTNPYAATKAGGEFLANSYRRSFGVPVVITRTSNLFGGRQHPEKFVPMTVKKLLRGALVDIHTSTTGKVGSRRWVYAGEQARALAWLLANGEPGRVYHVAAGTQMSNLEMAQAIAKVLGIELRDRLVSSDRSSYDQSYALEESAESVNWRLTEDFETLLARTVRWYVNNQEYLEG